MENLMQSARKSFGRLGWALITAGGVLVLLSLLSAVLIITDRTLISSGKQGIFDFSDRYAMTDWLIFRLPIYAAAIPAAIAILKKLPGSPVQKNHLSAKQFIGFGLTAIALQTPVSLLTVLFTDFVYREIQLPILPDAPGISIPLLLDSIILAPVFEELLFRKVLLDRFRRYGEGLAILISAGTFGLMHMNVQQTFTATILGAVLAYVYLRSGNLWYCALLHAASNFLAGGGIMPILLSRLSPKAWMLIQTQDEELLTPDIAAELYPLVGYLLLFSCLVVVGWIILIRSRKQFRLLPVENELSPKQAAAAVFSSAGMILYIVITLLVTILYLAAPFYQ